METTEDSKGDKLTVAEETLRDVLAQSAAARTGSMARAHGWPLPTEAQLQEMTRLICRVLTDTVRMMRVPGALAPCREELEATLDGVAHSILEHVMGPPPPPDVVH